MKWSEKTRVDFIGYASENTRYDYAIVYTDRFFGKSLVVCMQTGRSSFLCYDDAQNVEYLQKTYKIAGREEAEELSVFLQQHLPAVSHHQDQY